MSKKSPQYQEICQAFEKGGKHFRKGKHSQNISKRAKDAMNRLHMAVAVWGFQTRILKISREKWRWVEFQVCWTQEVFLPQNLPKDVCLARFWSNFVSRFSWIWYSEPAMSCLGSSPSEIGGHENSMAFSIGFSDFRPKYDVTCAENVTLRVPKGEAL